MKKTMLALALLAGCAPSSSSAIKVTPETKPSTSELQFITKDGNEYDLNILAKKKGVAVMDKQGNIQGELHFYEADEIDSFRNVDTGDYFILHREATGDTFIIRYNGVTASANLAHFTEAWVGGQDFGVLYDPNTMKGHLFHGGFPYEFIVESYASPRRAIGIDQNGNRAYGDEVPIEFRDGRKTTLDQLTQ